MESHEAERLVQVVADGAPDESETAWAALKPLGAAVVPCLLAAYPRTSRWQGRVRLVYYAIPFARTSDAAVQLGLAALRDRATLVRYRACGLLAYAQRPEARPALEALLTHADPRTRADAAAALDALQTRNHHYFVDRTHSGRVTWRIGSGLPGASDDPTADPAGGGGRGLWHALKRLLKHPAVPPRTSGP
ncbi:MAG TPA: HEAT repeat domain-containing protein [Gemmatimonadales bacterium]|nr:HEAT repeat domain-containing protein [Gemmatimonadales bacterium]